MRRLDSPATEWPPEWKQAFAVDSVEVWGVDPNPGYTWAYRRRLARSLAAVRRNLPTGSRVLDLAAGAGNLSIQLAEAGYRVVWNDIIGSLAGYVELKRELGDIEYRPGNAFDLSGEGFEGVVMNEVIEHVAHPDDLLRTVSDLVRPGGFVFLTTPNGSFVKTGVPTFDEIEDPALLESVQFQPGAEGHLFLLTNDELRRLAGAAGLEVVEVENFTSPVLAGYGVLAKVARRVPERALAAVNRVVEAAPGRQRTLVQTAAVLRRS